MHMNAALYILNDNQDMESPTCILWASLHATSNVLKYFFSIPSLIPPVHIFRKHDLSTYLVA